MTETHEDKDELQLYELGYHLVPSLGEEDLALRVADLQKNIASLGGSIHSEGAPQSFTLAYTMHKMRGGRWDRYDMTFFGWTRFTLAPEKVAELKEELDHDEHMVRYLLIKLDKAALVPPKERKPRPIELTEVATEPKELEHKRDTEEKGDVSEEELDKQIEELIK
jgi:ribosomal protein S6